MKTKYVRFGKSDALRIMEPDGIRTELEKKLGYSISAKRYSMLNWKNIKRLEDTVHRVSVNTLGRRFLLFLTTIEVDGKTKRYSIFMNRKNGMMIIVRFRFSSDLFNDTLFEGELVRVNEEHYYLISDLLIDRGRLTHMDTFDERLIRLADIMDKDHVADTNGYLHIQIKSYFGYEYIQSIVNEYTPSVAFKSCITGLTFKAEIGRSHMVYILPNFRNNSTTSTTCTTHTTGTTRTASAASAASTTGTASAASTTSTTSTGDMDGHFKVVVETDLPDVYELYNRNGVSAGYAVIPDTSTSKLMEQFMLDTNGKDLYVKCKFNKKFSKWTPYERATTF